MLVRTVDESSARRAVPRGRGCARWVSFPRAGMGWAGRTGAGGKPGRDLEDGPMHSPAAEVTHNAAARRFEAKVDGLVCRCDYRMHGNTMMLVHTEVPPQLEGRGLASLLVRAAFEHAKARGMDVMPVCSYVRTWVQRHPEYSELLTQ